MIIDKIAPARDYDNVRAAVYGDDQDQDLESQSGMVAIVAADFDQAAIVAKARSEERIESLVRSFAQALHRELNNDKEK